MRRSSAIGIATLAGIVLFGATFRGTAEDSNVISAVMAEAQKAPTLESNLRQLTDEIGGRVPGTPAMKRAVAWAVSAFKAAGADSVHKEEFSIPNSWAEGATRMDVTAPVQFRVRAVSMGWAPALAPAQRVPVVDVGEGTSGDFAKAGNIAGKVVLVHTTILKTWEDLFGEYLKATPIVAAAVKGKAKAVAFMATREHDILYRHTNTANGRLEQLPMVLVAREDGERMARLLASGKKLFVDLLIPNRTGGPVQTANVVAELRGNEKPDEYVVLGAHLDSWELGTGALDNGCNAALVIEALRAIKASGVKPQRSIRFVLFSGEEQGLLGSRAYVARHVKEMDKVQGVVIFDSGSGRVSGFSLGGRKDVVDTARSIVAPLAGFGADKLTTDASVGTDHVDFLLQGVPTLVANQEEANYLVNYHATSDTFDKVDLPQLTKHVAEAAAVSLALANSPQRLGPRIRRAEIEQTMRETGLDQQMKLFNMWNDWEKGNRGRTD
jgi:Zn-dependent M28 family amino/carboxypeptidase